MNYKKLIEYKELKKDKTTSIRFNKLIFDLIIVKFGSLQKFIDIAVSENISVKELNEIKKSLK